MVNTPKQSETAGSAAFDEAFAFDERGAIDGKQILLETQRRKLGQTENDMLEGAGGAIRRMPRLMSSSVM